MTDVVTNRAAVIAANTPVNNPVVFHTQLGDSQLESVMLVFPPGASGLVGARVQYAGTPLYPNSQSGWYVLDDYTIVIDVTNQGTGGTWEISAYNTDINPHTIQVYYYWNYLRLSGQNAPSPLIAL